MIAYVRSRHDTADSLADIIENAERIERYLDGIDLNAFAENTMMRGAVERCLARICEAGHRLGSSAVELMPTQPWSDIRGMGNRLRHAYDQISLGVLWNAARHEVPALADEARRALRQIETGKAATD